MARIRSAAKMNEPLSTEMTSRSVIVRAGDLLGEFEVAPGDRRGAEQDLDVLVADDRH